MDLFWLLFIWEPTNIKNGIRNEELASIKRVGIYITHQMTHLNTKKWRGSSGY